MYLTFFSCQLRCNTLTFTLRFWLHECQTAATAKGGGERGEKTILTCFILPQWNMEFPALFSECLGSGTGRTCMWFNNTFGINICVKILKPLFFFFPLVSLLETNKSFVPLRKHCSVPFGFKSCYIIFLSEEFFSIKHHTVSLFITSFTCYQFQCFFPSDLWSNQLSKMLCWCQQNTLASSITHVAWWTKW